MISLSKASLSAADYSTAVGLLLAQQPIYTETAKLEAAAIEATDKARAAAMATQDKATQSAQDALAKQLEHNATIGLSTTALAQLEAANLSLQATELERKARLQDGIMRDTIVTDGYLKEAKALRELAAAKVAGAGKQAGVAAADALAKANKSAAEASGKYWEDALMRAFESGKGFFQSLWDTIKNTLKTQVLKVMVSATGVTGMTAASAGDSVVGSVSAASSMLSLTENVGKLANAFNGAGLTAFAKSSIGQNIGLSTAGTVGNNASAYVAPELTTAGNAFAGMPIGGIMTAYSMGGVKGFATGVASTALAGGVAASIAGTGFMAGATGALAAIGPWGWAAMGAAALLGMGGGYTSTSGTGEASRTFDAKGNATGMTAYEPYGGMSATADTTIAQLQATYAAQALALGVGTVGTNFGYGGNTGREGVSPNFALRSSAGAIAYNGAETPVTKDALQLEASRAVFAALQGSENFKSLSYDAIQNLAGFSGGIDKLQASLGTFYDNFYSTDVKTAHLTAQTTKAFEALGIAMPAVDSSTRDWYRGIVEAQLALDQSIPGNAAVTASVLSLQSAINTLAPAFDAAAKTASDLASAQDSAYTNMVSAQREVIAMQQQAADAAAQAAKAVRDALASAGGGIVNLIRELTTTGGGTLGPMALMQSTQSAYLADLSGAKAGDLQASERIAASARAYLDAASAVNANSRQSATVAQVISELGKLPAVATFEQQLLEAVKGTTGAVVDLNGQLVVELTATAKSEIYKLISFVANTDALPDDLKTLALATSNTLTRTVGFITGSLMPGDLKALALAQNSTVTRTVSFVAGSSLTNELKQLAFMASDSISKTIGLVAKSTLTADQQRLALAATESVSKTIGLVAVSSLTNELKQLAFMASDSISKTIGLVAKSTLTADQQRLALAATESVSKTIGLVAVSSLTNELKQLAFMASDSISKTIGLVAKSTLTADQQRLALAATEAVSKTIRLTAQSSISASDQSLIFKASDSVIKTIGIAAGAMNDTALAIAQAQSDTITRTIEASGGTLTADQRDLINGVSEYYKNVTISALVDEEQLTEVQRKLQRTYGTIIVDVKTVDVSTAVGQAQATKMRQDLAYLQTYNWDTLDAQGASLRAIYDNLANHPITMVDMVNAVPSIALADLQQRATDYGVPLFAAGGYHTGGARIVGEHGPELEVTGPSRIYNAADTMAMLRNPQANNEALVAEIRALRQEVADLRRANSSENAAIATHAALTADSTRRMDTQGVMVYTDPAEPISTKTAA